ncbi:embryonic polarity protein dorsal-like isoform X2 [Venturia canescens]|uniref:embryonic polarity protein dorsal-like isoform X2 n=1 Tax=Venturia canescens TaxID=32260 RepID=UPI001C9BC647|nr:embryonic polarity protein dorsal-like isoform X2 [Venturia canescens]
MEPFFGMSDNNINISDVIEVIQTTDPGFVDEDHCSSSINMLSGGGVERVRPVAVSTGSVSPFVEIIEQPASKALRFRYECEGRSAGSIPGINSTVENKTFPSIRIVGYKGRAVVVVSCVTKDQPYRPHPHNLVGKEGCKKGVCTVEVATENMTVTFANLGIQCVKKKDIEDALRVREEMRVDPFRTGFEHKKQPTSIDLNAVRLCFQVFLEGTEKGKFNVPLPSVVSDPIYDKKAMSDLVICKLSHCSASVAGGLEMILLCEKVAKEDIQVKFYEERDGQLVWEGYGDFQPSQVHKQVAIAFRTPTYRIQQVEQPVQVFIQLKRPSDGAISESLPFQMLPLGSDDPDTLRRKRQKFNNSPNALVLRHVQAEAEKHAAGLFDQPIRYNFNLVKPEPMDNALSPYGGCMAGATSPLYPVGNSSPPLPSLSAQSLRPRLSPRRTPSPMDCMTYNIPSMQPQPNLQIPYLETQNPQPILQSSAGSEIPHQMAYDQQQPRATATVEAGLGLEPLMNAADNNVLDLDSQQYSFDMSLNQLDSAELAIFGTALSENLSSGLSISDPVKVKGVGGNNGEGNNSMTDSFTRLTTNTIQEICTLNSMYKPPADN